MNREDFEEKFESLTSFAPLPWQTRLYFEFFERQQIPDSVDIPTGLGKTAVVALWLIAIRAGLAVPRRLIYVVDRRAVVDQATRFVEQLREMAALPDGGQLPISTLRGQHADNREWLDDPARPAIVVGTVDMIGSRLLFEGYGVSRKMRPYHAAMLGADTLVVLDEAHLLPPFERLLSSIEQRQAGALGAKRADDRALIPRLRLLSLSATGRANDGVLFALQEADFSGDNPAARITRQRLNAKKTLVLAECNRGELVQTLVDKAWALSDSAKSAARYLVFCDVRKDAEAVRAALQKKIDTAGPEHQPDVELLVGGRRGYERRAAENRLESMGFIDGKNTAQGARFLVATSAGEVGVDMDADHMICDLVAWDRIVQRLGRVNRRGDGDARIFVFDAGLPNLKFTDVEKRRETLMMRQVRALLATLPTLEEGCDASPDALRTLKQNVDDDLVQIISEASTPTPWRPALTRPLLDAWAMTSLPQHTGRPEVAPWLRGWTNDDPQTAVVWRAHLPVPDEAEKARRWERDVTDYFEAAPAHVLEKLETETFRATQWLSTRAKKLHKALVNRKKREDAPTDPEREILSAGEIVAMTLSSAGDRVKTYSLQALNDFDKKRLERELIDKTLVVDARIGGLSAEGMLAAKQDGGPEWLAKTWLADRQPLDSERAPTWRVQKGPQGEDWTPPSGWQAVYRCVLKRNADGDVVESLDVYKLRHSQSTEEARALATHNQSLKEHQNRAERQAGLLAEGLGLPERYAAILQRAARLHDEGKQADRWQNAFNAPRDGTTYAKTTGPVNVHMLDGYRHEFGSLHYLGDRIDDLNEADRDLVLHLIAAHHGNARPTISTRGCDHAPPSLLEQQAGAVAKRFARLQRRWGPWGLAWWETLLRAADQQASRLDQKEAG